VAYDATWRGRRFVLVDTGGWEPKASGLAARVSEQAEFAAAAADAVVFVIDSTVGATEADLAAARVLRRTAKPVLVAATKVDESGGEVAATELWALGLGEPHPVSGLHGRGSGDLLDAILAVLPQAPADVAPEPDGPRRVALIGRPNVGKSSLLNRLVGEERVLVDATPGTTRDPVDSLVQLGGSVWRFVDTAGLRRRVRTASGAEFYASIRTSQALDAAEVGLVLLDASEPMSEQDQRVCSAVIDAGRALVLALNKWDLVDEDRRVQLDRELDRDFSRVAWAPRVNVSAKTGRSMDRLAAALERALAGWETRVATGPLNSWLAEVVAATPPPARGGRAPKVLFATQAATRPPQFVFFTTGHLEAGYRRFLERRLREDFGFEGSPIAISVRNRSARKR
jgi:GTP-binding protein